MYAFRRVVLSLYRVVDLWKTERRTRPKGGSSAQSVGLVGLLPIPLRDCCDFRGAGHVYSYSVLILLGRWVV